jgi:hypothetical protein
MTMAADDMKEVNDPSEDFDLADFDLDDEEKGQRRPPSGRVFWMFTLGLAVIVIAVLGITGYLSGFLPGSAFRFEAAQEKPPQAVLTEVGSGGLQQPGQEDGAAPQAGSVTTPVPEREYEQTPVAAIPSATIMMEITEAGEAERTATVAALLTQAAAVLTQTTSEVQLSETPINMPTVMITPLTSVPTVMVTPATTALPKTGWADEVGLPMMVVLAIALIVVIIFVRILRTARSG